VASLLSHATSRLAQLGIDPMHADVEAHYHWIEGVVRVSSQTITVRGKILDYAAAPHLSDRVDRILLHRVWGLLIFTAIMSALFVSVFWLATPIMDGIQWLVSRAGESLAGILPDGPIHDLWTDGIVAGVGTVLVFVPQIALLFLFLSILEDTGYLARAAFLMDRLLAKVGLHGKSFIPLLSSFACAIPGIMATRTIESRRDRLTTIFVAPFMSCSARLPVYALLIGTFFASFSPAARGGIMLALYALGILAAVGTALVFKFGSKRKHAQTFILELPSYKIPQFSQVIRTVWLNTRQFLTKAGTTIFCLSVILWAMTYYPRLPASAINVIHSSNYSTAALQAYSEGATKDFYRPGSGGGTGRILLPTDRPGDPPLSDQVVQATRDAQLRDIRPSDLDRISELQAEAVAGEQLRHSIAGRLGHVIEPVIKP
ncbi:MAG: nucleoside recognition domain-containing protein, partial [Tepidisphaeraceae bacterium]